MLRVASPSRPHSPAGFAHRHLALTIFLPGSVVDIRLVTRTFAFWTGTDTDLYGAGISVGLHARGYTAYTKQIVFACFPILDAATASPSAAVVLTWFMFGGLDRNDWGRVTTQNRTRTRAPADVRFLCGRA